MRTKLRQNMGWCLAAGACLGLLGCGPALPSFTAPPPAPAAPLPGALPAVDQSFALPTSKDEVSIDLHPRAELRESVAADSDERTALAASIVLTLPPNRAALRQADVSVAVKKRPGGEVAETQRVSFTRDTREAVLTVPLGSLGEGAYDVDVHTVARVDVLDEDWTVMTDTKEATERAPLVIGGAREQAKSFEFHFDDGKATPLKADLRTLDREILAIDALLAAHPGATARVDCWTSSKGEEAVNRVLAAGRCDWFKRDVWSRISHPTKDPLAVVPHNVSELAVTERSRDLKVQSRNRVVRLRVRWSP